MLTGKVVSRRRCEFLPAQISCKNKPSRTSVTKNGYALEERTALFGKDSDVRKFVNFFTLWLGLFSLSLPSFLARILNVFCAKFATSGSPSAAAIMCRLFRNGYNIGQPVESFQLHYRHPTLSKKPLNSLGSMFIVVHNTRIFDKLFSSPSSVPPPSPQQLALASAAATHIVSIPSPAHSSEAKIVIETRPSGSAQTSEPTSPASSFQRDLNPINFQPAHESRRRNAEQRAATLRADPLIGHVEANRVFCSLCQKWVQLRQDSSYCAYPWLQHRGKCLTR
jgi:hypothetical protein